MAEEKKTKKKNNEMTENAFRQVLLICNDQEDSERFCTSIAVALREQSIFHSPDSSRVTSWAILCMDAKAEGWDYACTELGVN